MVLESEEHVYNFGWGDAEGFKAIGLFYTGAQMLAAGYEG
jgi:hypothetical protein